jgi:hypothetical protein
VRHARNLDAGVVGKQPVEDGVTVLAEGTAIDVGSSVRVPMRGFKATM